MTWNIDAAHSAVEFSAKHMMISTVRGRFTEFTGTVNLDEKDLTHSSVEWTLQAASLTTGNEQRDAHLRSGDFLEAETYPTITFKSTRVERASADRYTIYGDLTIKDVTREVSFQATDEGQGKDPWGNTHWGFTVTGSLNRKEFGLNWNVALETGGVLVGEQIKIALDVELVAVPAPVAAAVAEQEAVAGPVA
jgi:polyisoprenoid-binding protein YceI